MEFQKKGEKRSKPATARGVKGLHADGLIKSAQDRARERYLETQKKYSDYFMKCLDDIEALQPNAFAGVQVSRIFTVGVLPKYCKIKDPLTPEQRERVEQILKG